jgi:hypothetical protein
MWGQDVWTYHRLTPIFTDFLRGTKLERLDRCSDDPDLGGLKIGHRFCLRIFKTRRYSLRADDITQSF